MQVSGTCSYFVGGDEFDNFLEIKPYTYLMIQQFQFSVFTLEKWKFMFAQKPIYRYL